MLKFFLVWFLVLSIFLGMFFLAATAPEVLAVLLGLGVSALIAGAITSCILDA